MCPGRTTMGMDPLLRVVEISGEGWEEQGHCGSQSAQRLGRGLGKTGSLWFSEDQNQPCPRALQQLPAKML